MGDKLPPEIDVRISAEENNKPCLTILPVKSLADSMELESPRYCGDTYDDTWEDIWHDKVSGISGG